MNDFYCAAPWRGLHINPRGDVKTCCAGSPNMLGNLNTSSIEEIINGPTLKQIRQDIGQGRLHSYCNNCIKAERLGANSERHWHNSVNEGFDYSSAGEQFHWPSIVDVRWNNTCNLSCNYCGPNDSSKWAGLKGIPFKSGTRPYYEQVCDFLEQHQEHIKNVALVGGEPLLLPENERLLDVIPQDCVITVITNLSTELQENKIFKKLAQRTRVGWSMSFDNIESRFEYVRYGSDWNLLLRNLHVMRNLRTSNGHWGGVHAVYNLYNATRLCEFKQFLVDNNLTVVWINLFHPHYLDPFNHGTEFAQLAANEIYRLIDQFELTDEEKTFFTQALEKYKSITQTKLDVNQDFVNFTAQLESQYHANQKNNFQQLWPELSFLFD